MNIDERLEKLTERTEALTHSVELLAAMQLKTEKNLNRLGKYIRGVFEIVMDHEARLRGIEGGEDEARGEDAQ